MKIILTYEGKVTTKIFLEICPLIQDVKRLDCEIGNVIMNRSRNPFWTDVMKQFKKLYNVCIPKTFDDFVSE